MIIITIEKILQLKKNLFEFKNIKTKLIAIIVVILIVSGTVLTGIAAFMVANEWEQTEIAKLHTVGQASIKEFYFVIEIGRNIARSTSLDPSVELILLHSEDGTLTLEEQLAVSEHLADIQAGLNIPITSINILDNNGIIRAASVSSIIGRDNSQQDFFKNQQKGAFFAKPFLGNGGVPVIPYASPVYDDSGRQIGLVGLSHEFPGFDADVFSTAGLSKDATNFLVDSDGTILSGVNGDYTPFLTKKFDLRIFAAGASVAQAPGYYGNMEYIVKTPFPGTDWFIITTETVDAVNEPIMNLVMAMIASLFFVIIAGGVIAIFIANTFARPIRALTDNAEQLALGDVDVAITHVSIDEIGKLADSFRHIAENTQKKAESVRRIAAGDVVTKLIVTSDRDVQGHALIQMKKSLFHMTESLQTLANHSAEGDLSYCSDASLFEGVYRELIETLNYAFEQVIYPVQEAIRLSTSYSSGDYSERFDPEITVKGDFISFKTALNQIGINSSDALLKIRSGIHNISADAVESSNSVEEIANSVVILAESSSHVSSLVERNEADLAQAVTAMNDLADTVSEVAQRTTSVSELAHRASDLAYDGVKCAELAEKGMKGVIESSTEIAKSVSDMSSHMDEIGKIVDVISNIAEQTSLLALNAAIEAARAGDAGLGFAVVADEVKALAQNSQTSAEHISSIIANLQKMSEDMTIGMEKAAKVVESGNSAVSETITIFQQMNEAVSDVSRNMSDVAAASEEQAASVEEITASMSEMQAMLQDTAKEAIDSAVAAEEISSALNQVKLSAAETAQLADMIAEQVNQFKIE